MSATPPDTTAKSPSDPPPADADEPSAPFSKLLCALRSFVRWTARILSAPITLYVLVLTVGAIPDILRGQIRASDLIYGLGTLVPLMIAWRWELLGGGLLLIMTTVHAYATRMHEEPWGSFLGWMFAFLFLTAGSLKTATNPAASRRAVSAARIVSWLFALLACLSLYGCYRVRGTFNG